MPLTPDCNRTRPAHSLSRATGRRLVLNGRSARSLKLGSTFWRGLAAGSLLVVDLVVTVKPGSDLNAVTAQLAQAGLQVHSKLEAIGSVTGSAQDADIARLR